MNLADEIRLAQREAGEAAVIANLERMGLVPKPTVATELEYLQFFYQSADFGPADDDVHQLIEEDFTKKTGLSLPPGYVREA